MSDFHFQTPPWVCNYMVSLLSPRITTILEPTPGKGNLVDALGDKYTITVPDDFWNVQGRWDCIVMNPPFTPMTEGYKILYACMEMSDLIIMFLPLILKNP